MQITFNKVELKSIKQGSCKCGRKTKRTKVFFQTINPFNVNSFGIQKNQEEIYKELKNEIDSWKKEKIICSICDGSRNIKSTQKRVDYSKIKIQNNQNTKISLDIIKRLEELSKFLPIRPFKIEEEKGSYEKGNQYYNTIKVFSNKKTGGHSYNKITNKFDIPVYDELFHLNSFDLNSYSPCDDLSDEEMKEIGNNLDENRAIAELFILFSNNLPELLKLIKKQLNKE